VNKEGKKKNENGKEKKRKRWKEGKHGSYKKAH